MILIINTTDETQRVEELTKGLEENNKEYEVVEAGPMKIGHCIGCNHCWLKNPGECTVKDDHEKILRKMVHADQIWFISDTTLNFVSPKTKNIVDRMIPLATMLLTFKNGQMRHVMRYKKGYDVGFLIRGEADMEFLERWSERVAVNTDGHSRGVFSMDQVKEAVACM